MDLIHTIFFRRSREKSVENIPTYILQTFIEQLISFSEEKSKSKRKQYIDKIQELFFTKSFAFIKSLCAEFYKVTGKPIHSVVGHVFPLKDIINYAQDPIYYFAKRIKNSRGFNQMKFSLNLVIILSCEVNMAEVKIEFERVYGMTLREFVRQNASGFHKYALYELIGEVRSNKKVVVNG